jgi:hypothetical protein
MCGGMSSLVVCAGGYNGGGAVNATYVYDLTANLWLPRAPIAGQGSWWGAGTAMNGTDLYLFGGVLDQFATVTAMAMRYDTLADAWAPIESMNHARYRLAGASGSLVALGGAISTFNVTAHNELYPLALAPTPTPMTPTPGPSPAPTQTPTRTPTPRGRCELLPPDPFGYRCTDWETRPYIDATTNTGITDDDQVVNVPIGFGFKLYGNGYADVRISSNGNLQFTTTNVSPANTCPLPDLALGFMIAPYWDDLYPPAGGAVEYSLTGLAPNRIFTVEWDGLQHFPASASGVTFEVQLEEATGDIWLLYQDVEFGDPALNRGASASIGIQNGGIAFQYGCQESVLLPNDVVRIYRPPPAAGNLYLPLAPRDAGP